MSVWKPSVTVAAVIERHGKFLLIQERISGRPWGLGGAGSLGLGGIKVGRERCGDPKSDGRNSEFDAAATGWAKARSATVTSTSRMTFTSSAPPLLLRSATLFVHRNNGLATPNGPSSR